MKPSVELGKPPADPELSGELGLDWRSRGPPVALWGIAGETEPST
jgi:hypothetical protein